MSEDRELNQSAGTRPGALWSAFATAEPELADRVRRRFAAYPHHVLATIRKDGSPRLTGLEADFRFGELWLGMMPGSRKALDLRRDPRFALHANPGTSKELEEGDVRISGIAVEITDPELIAGYAGEVEQPGPFHLFRVELTEVVRVSLEVPHIVMETWRPGEPLRTIRRTNEEPPAREEPAD